MSRFGLAGLLRVRAVQEEQARRSLGSAQRRLSRTAEELRRRQEALAHAGTVHAGSASTFLAGVAVRSSLAAAVNEAVALREAGSQELAAARSQWLEARMRARAIERLAERHRAEQLAEQGRVEQALSDDLAGARHAARATARGEQL